MTTQEAAQHFECLIRSAMKLKTKMPPPEPNPNEVLPRNMANDFVAVLIRIQMRHCFRSKGPRPGYGIGGMFIDQVVPVMPTIEEVAKAKWCHGVFRG